MRQALVEVLRTQLPVPWSLDADGFAHLCDGHVGRATDLLQHARGY